MSWHRSHLDQSLAWIDALKLPKSAHLVDVGGGASTLVDDLLARDFVSISVADLSSIALDHSKLRLGARESQVSWVVGNVTSPLFPTASVDLWHDRAVFHFLTSEAQQQAYAAQVSRSVRPGGHLIVATFGVDGPERCSGLPAVRYTPEALAEAMGPDFELLDTAEEVHTTPQGKPQAFAYVLCRRRG